MRQEHEIVVIGAGPCGLGMGVAARQAGLDCVLFDRGCITRSIAGYPTYMSFFSTPEKLELGGLPFIVPGEKPGRREALAYYRAVVRRFGLDVRQYEEVVAVEGEAGAFRLRTRRAGGEAGEYIAANLVVATGFFDTPNLLRVPGEDLPKVTHYYREAHPYHDQDCLVVGAGNSAAEAALDLYRTGARVTLVHFAAELDRRIKPWVLPDIANRLESGEIAVRWRTRVAEIRERAVVLACEQTGERTEIRNDWVVAMTGYTPDTRLLRSLGVSVDQQTGIPAHSPDTMETDVPGVFIAGVLAAGRDANKIFIENGREHGPRIVRAIQRKGALGDPGSAALQQKFTTEPTEDTEPSPADEFTARAQGTQGPTLPPGC